MATGLIVSYSTSFLGKLVSDFGHGIHDLCGQRFKFFTQFRPYNVPERLHWFG